MSAASVEIAASILNADLGALREAVQEAERAGVDRIHLDIMDGHFVPNLTFGLATVEALRGATRLPLDAHLMIDRPSLWARRYAEAGCATVAIHVEAAEAHASTLDAVRRAGAQSGLALDPGTPWIAIEPYASHLDFALVMTVKSGFGGQAYRPEAAAKIGSVRTALSGAPVHVDGGITSSTAADAVRNGGSVLVSGTAIFGSADRMAAVRALRAAAVAGS
jgi:ribulose-phosphate 3-epimerase